MAKEKNFNILILEDDVELMSFLNMILLNEGFKNIFKATKIAEALEHYKTEKLHGMFIDISLTDGNGLDLAKSIRSKNPKVKLVLMSGSMSTDMAEDLKRVADGFLLKPFQAEQLLKTIKSVFKKART